MHTQEEVALRGILRRVLDQFKLSSAGQKSTASKTSKDPQALRQGPNKDPFFGEIRTQ